MRNAEFSGQNLILKNNQTYDEKFAIHANNPDKLYAASKIYTKIGNYTEALNIINNALSFDGNNINYIYQRAYIKELMGNSKDALSDYESIIRMRKNYAAANYRAALVYLNNLKNDTNSETYALNYLALVPDDYSGYKLLADIYKFRAERYIDANTKNLLKEALNNYQTALSKAVWGRDLEARNIILKEINNPKFIIR